MNFFRNKCVRDLPQSEVVSGFLTTYKDKYSSGNLYKCNGQKSLYHRCLRCVSMDKDVFLWGQSFYSLNNVKNMVRKVAKEVTSWYRSYGR